MRQALQHSAEASAAVSGAPAAGAEPLLQLLKSFSKADGLKTSITVGEDCTHPEGLFCMLGPVSASVLMIHRRLEGPMVNTHSHRR